MCCVIDIDDPRGWTLSILSRQLVRLREKITKARIKGDEDGVKKYEFQIKATSRGLYRILESLGY